MLQPVFLRDTENEREAALLLRYTRPVLVRVAKDHDRHFEDNGFKKCFDSLECFIDLNLQLNGASRRMRSRLFDAIIKTEENDTLFRFLPADTLERTAILEKIYYGVIVPHLYAKGLSPYGVQNEATFLSFIKVGDTFAINEKQGKIVSVGILRPKGHSRSILEGLLWASQDPSQESYLWFLQKCIHHAASSGFSYLSLGIDLPWMQLRYASTFLQKMRLCNFVALHRSSRTSLFADFSSVPEEPHLLFLASDPPCEAVGIRIPDPLLRGLGRLVARKAVIYDNS